MAETLKFRDRFDRMLTNHTRKAAKKDALKAVGDWIRENPNDENFEAILVDRVRACIEAGIPASNKELANMTMPFAQILKDDGDKEFLPLVRQMEQYKVRAMGNFVDRTEEKWEDPNYTRSRDELRKITKSKRLLIIGGKPYEESRRDALKDELSLAAVEWPDCEPSTKLDTFMPFVSRSDIVCMAIRFSRHSYKNVIDKAKKEGKMTAMLRAGLSQHRIVHDLHQQLIPLKNGA